jgi:hypothetical protein
MTPCLLHRKSFVVHARITVIGGVAGDRETYDLSPETFNGEIC